MAIRFIKSADSSQGESELTKALSSALSNRRQVLWLLSGGSNIGIACRVMESIEEKLTVDLQIMLADERYGPVGHKDSNYQQLIEAGFDKKLAKFNPVLLDDIDAEQTTKSYEASFETAVSSVDLIIGQLGIGDDGHIAGILPGAEPANSDQLVIYYESNPYKRISLGFKALNAINIVFVFCFGSNKLDALNRLKSGTEDGLSLPSMVLSNIKEVTVYNDQIGDLNL